MLSGKVCEIDRNSEQLVNSLKQFEVIMGKENENLPLEEYKKIVEFSQKEIEGVRSYYKWAASIIGLIFIAGTVLTINSFSNLRSDIRELKEDSKKEVNLLSQKLKADLEVETNTIKNEIISRINKEFDKENIQLLVEQKAKERIDEIADKIIEKKIAERINPKIEAALTRITVTEKTISDDKEFIADVTKVVAEIAAMLPEATGYGAGLTSEQQKLLIKYSEYLKGRLKNIKK